MTQKISPAVKSPDTFEELIENLNKIVGKSIYDLAKLASLPLPINTTHGKGFMGELLEVLLGASAQTLPIPDFPQLGLELKTLPVDDNLVPLESTFFSHAPLTNIRNLTFENSTLYSKIKRVLFVVINAQRDQSFEQRRIVGYIFYSPSADDLAQIKKDYDEIYELIKTGHVQSVNARIGHIIQMRPKAANGKALTQCIGPNGEIIQTRPRGFYMRRSYTTQLVMNNLKKSF